MRSNKLWIMTNLSEAKVVDLPGFYTLRTWIEYGFKQVKNELGWTDFRLTDYASIERWWEIDGLYGFFPHLARGKFGKMITFFSPHSD